VYKSPWVDLGGNLVRDWRYYYYYYYYPNSTWEESHQRNSKGIWGVGSKRRV